MTETASPFVPGARVAVTERFGNAMTEAFVEKVYKSGNFTLRGSNQQWKPWKSTWSNEPRWSAVETGSGYSRRRLDLWDETTDAEITEKIETERTRQRWRALRVKIEAVRNPTPAFCDALEAALCAIAETAA